MPSCPFFLISREEQPLNFFYSFFFQGIASEIPQAAGVLTAAIVPYHTIPFHTIVSHACRFLFLESAYHSQAPYSTLLYSPQIQSNQSITIPNNPQNSPNATNIPRYQNPLPYLPVHPIPSRHAKPPRPLLHPSINQAPHPTDSNTLRTRTIKQTNPQNPQKPLLVSDKSRPRRYYPLLYIALPPPPPQKTIHPSISEKRSAASPPTYLPTSLS